MVDNFTKQVIPESTSKSNKCTQFGAQVKEKSMKLTHTRNNKSTFGESYLAT
jgi:hypothetical protein